MWLSFVALLLGAAPGHDEALESFRRMEQQVLKCKTFEAQIEFAITGSPQTKK